MPEQKPHELRAVFQEIWQVVRKYHPGDVSNLSDLFEDLKSVGDKYHNKNLNKALYAILDYYEEAQK